VVKTWDDKEVAFRWLRVYPGQRMDEHLAAPTDIEVETLANKQDDCTGRFWEGRFKAQRLAEETALLACSMYVDLNPVRAAMAETPDQSVHTSAYDRIKGSQGRRLIRRPLI